MYAGFEIYYYLQYLRCLYLFVGMHGNEAHKNVLLGLIQPIDTVPFGDV